LRYFVLFECRSRLDATAEETISACKNAEKYAILTFIFENFSGDTAQKFPYWGGAKVPLLRTHPKGALRLSSA